MKIVSLLLLMILPLGAALFYRPVWSLSGSLFFFLVGAYLIFVSEVAKRRRLI
jgi:hypothetical protein